MQFWQDQSASWSGLHNLQLLALQDCHWQGCCFTNCERKCINDPTTLLCFCLRWRSTVPGVPGVPHTKHKSKKCLCSQSNWLYESPVPCNMAPCPTSEVFRLSKRYLWFCLKSGGQRLIIGSSNINDHQWSSTIVNDHIYDHQWSYMIYNWWDLDGSLKPCLISCREFIGIPPPKKPWIFGRGTPKRVTGATSKPCSSNPQQVEVTE